MFFDGVEEFLLGEVQIPVVVPHNDLLDVRVPYQVCNNQLQVIDPLPAQQDCCRRQQMFVPALYQTLVREVLKLESTFPCLKVMLHNLSPLDLIAPVYLAAIPVQTTVIVVLAGLIA